MAESYSTWAIRSFIIGLIAALLGLVGWLGTSKDQAVLKAISDLSVQMEKGQKKSEEADNRMTDAISKLCERVGGVEGRVGNLEIFIQMPFDQRIKLIRPPEVNGKKVKE